MNRFYRKHVSKVDAFDAKIIYWTSMVVRVILTNILKIFRLLLFPIALPIKFIRYLDKERTVLQKKFHKLSNPRSLIRNLEEKSRKIPLKDNRKTLFISVGTGQAVRTFLLSKCYDLLSDLYNLVILSPYANDVHFLESYEKKGVHVVFWPNIRHMPLQKIRRFYHITHSASETQRAMAKNLEASENLKISTRIIYKAMKILKFNGISQILALSSHFLFWMIVPRKPFHILYDFYKPALFINTIANNHSAWPLSFYSKTKSVKVLANVISWDNPSTKGIMDEYAEHYTLWSEEMRNEMSLFFQYINSEMHIVGSPQFDCYFDESLFIERREFLESLGMNPELPYIIYTTNTPIAMPDEPDIVRMYWEALKQSSLNGQINLLVRLHPKDDISRYEALLKNSGGKPVITLAGEPKTDGMDKWVPGKKEMYLLINSLRHAAVSINVASTMTLESFCVQKPTINVAFQVQKDFNKLLWDFNMYHTSVHYRALVDEGSVRLAHNIDELINLTKFYLQNPTEDMVAQKKVLKLKAGDVDGRSSERFVSVVQQILRT